MKEGGADEEPERKKGANTRMRERIQCFGIFLFFPSSTGCFLSPAPPGGLQKKSENRPLKCQLVQVTHPFCICVHFVG